MECIISRIKIQITLNIWKCFYAFLSPGNVWKTKTGNCKITKKYKNSVIVNYFSNNHECCNSINTRNWKDWKCWMSWQKNKKKLLWMLWLLILRYPTSPGIISSIIRIYNVKKHTFFSQHHNLIIHSNSFSIVILLTKL